jgi:hypothetical protein
MDKLDRETRLKYHGQIKFLLKLLEGTDDVNFIGQDEAIRFEGIKEDHSWDGLSCACGGGWLAGHLAGCPETLDEPLPPLAVKHRDYPNEIDDDLLFILGRPNFACAGIATALRADGVEVPTKSEAEQAHVIHWLLKMRLDHPEDWRKRVGEELDRIANAAASR